MDLFQTAENLQGFAKIGLYGLAGSGKSTTAVKIAAGLARLGGETKPIYYLDTETGSDWFVERMKELNIPFKSAKRRDFKSLAQSIELAEKDGAVLIIDSISHFWTEIKEAYMQKKNLKFMRMMDWGPVKTTWNDGYATKFTNAKCHIIVCGRVQDIYETITEGAAPEFIRTGDRMRAEKDFSHEPSLVLRMESIPTAKEDLAAAKTKKQRQGIKVSSDVLIRAFVMKDRSDAMNGCQIDFPSFDDFLPHLAAVNIGGEHFGVDTSKNSQSMFDSDDIPVSEKTAHWRSLCQDAFDSMNVKEFRGWWPDNKAAVSKDCNEVESALIYKAYVELGKKKAAE
ncbi:MAG: ATP-binding protein [Kiritimatiellae bacterium]|nr:ATP-binding protein [Kiritimatiellia bacterium]